VAENQREDQKLWLILFQIKAIRTRLNLLAAQEWVCRTLTILIGGGALIFLSALAFRPLSFLAAAAVLLVFALSALAHVARTAARGVANPGRAALIADDRAALKGRLATVIALAPAPQRSSLWPYLIADTYELRDKFEPAKVEPRWFSRSVVALAAVCLLVGALPMALRFHARKPVATSEAVPVDLTADLGNLEIRPADPSTPANTRVYADQATMRQLAEKIARAENQQKNQNLSSHWLNKARRLAENLQDQVTGRKPLPLPLLNLRLRSENPSREPPSSVPGSSAKNRDSGASMPSSGTGNGRSGNFQEQKPPASLSPNEADRLARSENGLPPLPNRDAPSSSAQDEFAPTTGSGAIGEAGSRHSGGADPEHLFGSPMAQELGADNFKITVDARPVDEASSAGAPAYLPPKVRVPLNSQQFPDEPLARAAVPFEDSLTIKRVFER
jgi:hypothetical protein